MPSFRHSSTFPHLPLVAAHVCTIIEDAIRPGNFFVGPGLRLNWTHQNEQTHWELFRGRALDHTQTRRTQSFESWDIREADASADREPLLSVKFDSTAGWVFVTRSIRCRTWEGYIQDGQALSRETVRRVRELVGSIDLQRFPTEAALHDELIALLFHAVIGTSRLPLTSLEAPMPEFTFGQFAYCYRARAGDRSFSTVEGWLAEVPYEELAPCERSRLLESSIRAESGRRPADLAHSLIPKRATIQSMLNDVALSPYTDFVTRTVALLHELSLASASTTDEIDVLTQLLRQVCRHLTSFDLVKFHHRGANYPDALLLEEVTARVRHLTEAHPNLLRSAPDDEPHEVKAKRLRRRALRQAWLVRQQFRGRLVPDAPTSPGENLRVLPGTSIMVPDEQISDIAKRTRRLFTDNPELDRPSAIVAELLRKSVADLAEPIEMRELGIGLFLNRPLGFAKANGEPDATIMLAHEAFSRQIAESRHQMLRELRQDVPLFKTPELAGVRWHSPQPRQRPGVVSVQDAQTAAGDFVYCWTTRSSVRQFFEQYEWHGPRADEVGQWMMQGERCLILPCPKLVQDLLVYDERWQLRLRLRMDSTAGYWSRAGADYLAAGMSVLEAWDVRGDSIGDVELVRLLPRR